MQINFAFCMTVLNCWYGTTENWQISWGISFHTNASTSVAVTNRTSSSFLRTCSYLMLHYIKIPNVVLYDLDWLFKLKTHWVAEEYGAPFVKILYLYLTDLAQKLLSLRTFSYLCAEIPCFPPTRFSTMYACRFSYTCAEIAISTQR